MIIFIIYRYVYKYKDHNKHVTHFFKLPVLLFYEIHKYVGLYTFGNSILFLRFYFILYYFNVEIMN